MVVQMSASLSLLLLLGILIILSGDISNTLFRTTYLMRLESYKIGFRMFIENPLLGVGVNNYLISGTRYGLTLSSIKFGRALHNQYLLFLMETGIIGFSFYCLFMISSFRTTLSAVRYSDATDFMLWFPIGVLGSLIAFSIISIVDVPLVKEPGSIVLLLQIAAVVAISNRY